MCQYSSQNGFPNDWHLVHLGSRAVGGAGLIVIEATAVSPEGRISPDDLGIWSDEHIPSFQRLTKFMHDHGAVSGVQIAHAGRKASKASPWKGAKLVPPNEGGWQTLAPSPIPFDKMDPAPRELNSEDLNKVIADFAQATVKSLQAGFQVLEIHMAHGYLLHEFLSPISNQRQDHYGGSLENRMRFPLEVTRAVREKWPMDRPLFVRISATDWADGAQASWTLADSVILSRQLKALGVDLIDCSSGGTLPDAKIPIGPGYQTPFSEKIRSELAIMTAAVGMITEPHQAETVLQEGKADAIFIGREFLRDPYWPLHAAQTMGVKIDKPKQYGRS